MEDAEAPPAVSEPPPDPASLCVGFRLVWSFHSGPRRAPSAAFPAQGQTVALNPHGLVLSALYKDLELENKPLCFLPKEQAAGLPRRELSGLCNLYSPTASLKSSRRAKCLSLAGVLLSSSLLR